MWLITNFGFFSVVQKSGEELLTIRARARKDLLNLRDKHLPNMEEIIEGAGTDYPFRARVSHESFAEAARKITMDIDYSNFKNSVAKTQGSKRAKTYSRIWEVLLQLENEDV